MTFDLYLCSRASVARKAGWRIIIMVTTDRCAASTPQPPKIGDGPVTKGLNSAQNCLPFFSRVDTELQGP
ncbi:hypothetical protein RRG08_065979 [Elysia crispata]|uniref:Uncharacterized protein n=1 Tax=Elysia crispata TaxID=231223 RepID=A0AAE1A5E0_9GAST|nr:hypothetical protein RRG08_065979 [Elysia crispata]